MIYCSMNGEPPSPDEEKFLHIHTCALTYRDSKRSLDGIITDNITRLLQNPNPIAHLTLKVPEKLQLYGLYVSYVVHICDI